MPATRVPRAGKEFTAKNRAEKYDPIAIPEMLVALGAFIAGEHSDPFWELPAMEADLAFHQKIARANRAAATATYTVAARGMLESAKSDARCVMTPGSCRGLTEQCKFGKSFGFVAHGMGLIAHEAPRLWHNDEIGYDGAHAERALEARHGPLNRDWYQGSRGGIHQARRHLDRRGERLGSLWRLGSGLEDRSAYSDKFQATAFSRVDVLEFTLICLSDNAKAFGYAEVHYYQ